MFAEISDGLDILTSNPLFNIGLLLLCGFLFGRIASWCKLPEISGFILAGLLLGQSIGNVVTEENQNLLRNVTEIALAFIALNIGGDFYLPHLKKIGRKIAIITITQALFTFALVTLALSIVGIDVSFAAMLAAIAITSAPAAVVAIIKRFRIKGKLVDYLYGMMALTDVISIIVFGLTFALAGSALGTTPTNTPLANALIHSLGEVVFSIIIGAFAGTIIHFITHFSKQEDNVLDVSIAIVFILVTVATTWGFSSLLANITAGAVLINLSKNDHHVFKILDHLTPPIYLLLFVSAGLDFDLVILQETEILMLGILYVLARLVGKQLGTWFGAYQVQLKPQWSTQLGYTLLPQAGVAIALSSLLLEPDFLSTLSLEDQIRTLDLVNIVLFSVLVNELFGPIIARRAILKAAGKQ